MSASPTTLHVPRRIGRITRDELQQTTVGSVLSAHGIEIAARGQLPSPVPGLVLLDASRSHDPRTARLLEPLRRAGWSVLLCSGDEPVDVDAAGQSEPQDAGPDVPDLTDRERQVLGLIAAGHTNREIADRLFLSINTLKTNIRTAYRKAGVTRRAEAVAWALHHGLSET